MITKYCESCPPTSEKRINSNGYEKIDPFINVGTGGAILVYHRIYTFFKENGLYDGTNDEQKQYIT